MPAPTLETKRLILRPWKDEDLKDFALLNKDPKVMEFFPSLLSSEESNALAQRIRKELLKKNYGMWAVEIPQQAKFIGCVGLHYQDFNTTFAPCIEIGWRISSKYWGQGYATEGAKAALDYGFKTLNLKEIVAFTPEKHLKSRKVMQRLEMKHDPKENFICPKIPKEHQFQPFVLYRITKKEWLKSNKIFKPK